MSGRGRNMTHVLRARRLLTEEGWL
ncbi:TPA: N-acetylglucosamine-6-phosphate deacetylase, partial [Klebsiella pneumoniae]